MAVAIKTSKHCKGVTGADNCFDIGDVAIYTALSDGSKHEVVIEGELAKHPDAPGDGLVYNCLLNEFMKKRFGLERCALSAHQLTPTETMKG